MMDDITSNIYVYDDCPKCKCKCDAMPCWLDDLSQLKCDPEWVMTYGWQFRKDIKFKNHWYSSWKTGEYVAPKIDTGYYGWMMG